MKVLVVGAAGKTGRAVMAGATAAGHQVTAFVRQAEWFDVLGVDVIEGDANDPAAVKGQDAVLDTIGEDTSQGDKP